MFIAIITLACVISTNHVKTLVGEILNGLKYVLATTNFELMKWSWTRLVLPLMKKIPQQTFLLLNSFVFK